MRVDVGPVEEVASVKKKSGRLRKIITTWQRSFLLLDKTHAARFLEEGLVLSPDDIEELEGTAAMEAGLLFASNFLARRERSEKQVRKALRDEGLGKPEVIDYIVDTLRQKSYLDDRRFASELSKYLTGFRGAGPGLVRIKLSEAGVSSGIIDDVIDSTFPGGEEKRVALELAENRVSRMRGADSRKAASRVRGYLLRRGFSGAIVSDICCDILRGEFSGEQDERRYSDSE